MDVEFYDEDKHDYFLEAYTKQSKEPTPDEKKFFEPVLRDIVSEIVDVTGVSSDFKLYFAVSDEKNIEEKAPINHFVHGFSFPEWMDGFERNVIMIRAVNDRDNWKDCLVNMLAHEIAHQEFYKKKESAPYTNLENLIFEGHAMNRAEQTASELGTDWNPHYRSDEISGVDAESVIEVLSENRNYEEDNIFQNGLEPCSDAEGYQIAYLLVKKMIQEEGTSLDELPEQDIVKEEIEEKLESLLG